MKKTIKHSLKKAIRLPLILGMAFVIASLLVGQPVSALAQDNPPQGEETSLSSDECLVCHQIPDMVRPLEDGTELYLTVDPVLFKTSVHGRKGFDCVVCHTNINGYPHPELAVETAREFSIQVVSQACMQCHTEQAETYSKGRHAQEYLKGNTNSATCVDCHSAHSVQEFGTSHTSIAETCRACHSDIYDIYKESVHGSALLNDLNPDVPTCVNCHENHKNTGPGDVGYELFSPQICEECHNNEQLMAKYDLNADVYDTYISDFHGTTVVIFEKIAPDQKTNKPVCIDCHGVHDIQKHDDIKSSVMKDNIGTTCQRCHPSAELEFSESWLSHYKPDLEKNTLVYLVNLFYWLIIPGTIGVMLFFIITQINRKRIEKKAAASKSEGRK